jgi:hypothetical protein
MKRPLGCCSAAGRLLLLTGGPPGPGDSAESLPYVALGLGVPAPSRRARQRPR